MDEEYDEQVGRGQLNVILSVKEAEALASAAEFAEVADKPAVTVVR